MKHTTEHFALSLCCITISFIMLNVIMRLSLNWLYFRIASLCCVSLWWMFWHHLSSVADGHKLDKSQLTQSSNLCPFSVLKNEANFSKISFFNCVGRGLRHQVSKKVFFSQFFFHKLSFIYISKLYIISTADCQAINSPILCHVLA